RDEVGVEELLQDVRRDVADVALAAVDPVDDLIADIDEYDLLSRVSEELGEGHADIPGTDDRNVLFHDGRRLLARFEVPPGLRPSDDDSEAIALPTAEAAA